MINLVHQQCCNFELRAQALIVLLQTVIEQCNDDLEYGAMVTVEANRIRSRRLPLIT